MSQWYFDDDADLSFLEGKTVGIFGYGNQGRSQALNMRDHGVNVIVGSRSDASAEQSVEDGFETLPLGEAAAKADILFILVPDEVMAQIFAEHIEPHLEPGNTLVFASGYNIYFKLIVPRGDVNVLMIAPRMVGRGVRETFIEGKGYPSLVAVHQDATGNGKDLMVALSKAIGSTKMGVIESSFDDSLFRANSDPVVDGQLIFDLVMDEGVGVWGATPQPNDTNIQICGGGDISSVRNVNFLTERQYLQSGRIEQVVADFGLNVPTDGLVTANVDYKGLSVSSSYNVSAINNSPDVQVVSCVITADEVVSITAINKGVASRDMSAIPLKLNCVAI